MQQIDVTQYEADIIAVKYIRIPTAEGLSVEVAID
jgi:hypothetical protein